MSYGKIWLAAMTVTHDLLSGIPMVLYEKELIRLWNSILPEPGQPSAKLSKLIRLTACKKTKHAISWSYRSVDIPWWVAFYDTHKGKRWLNCDHPNYRDKTYCQKHIDYYLLWSDRIPHNFHKICEVIVRRKTSWTAWAGCACKFSASAMGSVSTEFAVHWSIDPTLDCLWLCSVHITGLAIAKHNNWYQGQVQDTIMHRVSVGIHRTSVHCYKFLSVNNGTRWCNCFVIACRFLN